MKRTNIRKILLILVLALTLVSCSFSQRVFGGLEIFFFDVGQGDCILLSTAGGNIMIDAGPEAAESELLSTLRRRGIDELELLILTHPDADHIGGADGIVEQLNTEKVWINFGDKTSDSVTRLKRALETSGANADEAVAGDSYSLGDLRLSVLSPADAGKNSNDASIVIRVDFGETSVLLMGDAEISTEKKLLKSEDADALDCDILKVGHHGSKNATGEEFLSVVTPEYAVISCGSGNSYGHPHGELLARLEDCGAIICRTDLSGTVVIQTDGDNIILSD